MASIIHSFALLVAFIPLDPGGLLVALLFQFPLHLIIYLSGALTLLYLTTKSLFLHLSLVASG
ncbi:hypothetical protein DFJ43DRAFT_1061854 [Lentinula guzmanii]|uniref:Uncharacterized protein n=1 Tax=Lentinula guzmanii TaxID=2804957 RepID=A0AA38N3T8_9AGAR|nr:hypothetical protein DFJ43DRAFT_1061854 [Lentinula guzmanii]